MNINLAPRVADKIPPEGGTTNGGSTARCLFVVPPSGGIPWRLSTCSRSACLLAAICFLLFLAPCTHADWKVESSQKLPSASPLITHVQKRLTSDWPVTLDLVIFDSRQCTLQVCDQPQKEGNLSDAMTRIGALAGINASFFHPDRTPLGLVISGGKKIHSFEQAKLLSGVLMVTRSGPALMRSARFDRASEPREAIQAGPFLVDGGRPPAELDNERRAQRSFVLTDGKSGWAIGTLRYVTLAEAGQILADRKVVAELTVSRALNLDGGSSTCLWVNSEPRPFYSREYSIVRTYLAIVSRK